ncbi:outer membrane beta-barrel protein [Methylorubrum sp. SB2]|uniref:outer membrane beta-barrel protein n=1 Tax=Methylorubrum subtropicum TaxID=3138812 RepID=UPI00313F1F79
MTRERPITGERAHRAGAGALAPALALALVLAGSAFAQDADPAANPSATDPSAASNGAEAPTRTPPRRPGIETVSPLRAGSPTSPLLGSSTAGSSSAGSASTNLFGPRAPVSPGDAPAASDSTGDDGVSRLPRFRTAPGLTGGATVNGARPSLLRQRAAPPRRLGSATKQITQARTQQTTTDLRLSPVIQNPVSGVPLPATFVRLGLVNPANVLGLGLGLNTIAQGSLKPIDPAYAPLGIRIGALTLLPAFTQSIGYDTNPNQTIARSAQPSLVLRSEGELAVRSDWSQAEFTSEMRGSYLEYPDNPGASRPNAIGVSRLRIDANRDTRIDVETRFLLDSQRAGSPDLNAATASRPLFASYGASVGVQENFNRLQVSLRGSLDRQVFEDARLSNGTVIRQSDRDANQYGVRLRAGYEVSPMFTPFVETLIDTRIYDTPVDQYGLRRDSDGIAFSAGASIEMNRALTAELSAGMQHRSYVDRSLRPIDAPLVSAALIWTVSPLTTVRFNQQTGVIETAVPGSSGAFTDVATLEVQHDLFRNLSINVGATYLSNNYEGVRIRERGYSAFARLDYRFNRWLTFRGSYLWSTLTSSSPNSSYEGHAVLLGVRVNP